MRSLDGRWIPADGCDGEAVNATGLAVLDVRPRQSRETRDLIRRGTRGDLLEATKFYVPACRRLLRCQDTKSAWCSLGKNRQDEQDALDFGYLVYSVILSKKFLTRPEL